MHQCGGGEEAGGRDLDISSISSIQFAERKKKKMK